MFSHFHYMFCAGAGGPLQPGLGRLAEPLHQQEVEGGGAEGGLDTGDSWGLTQLQVPHTLYST